MRQFQQAGSSQQAYNTLQNEVLSSSFIIPSLIPILMIYEDDHYSDLGIGVPSGTTPPGPLTRVSCGCRDIVKTQEDMTTVRSPVGSDPGATLDEAHPGFIMGRYIGAIRGTGVLYFFPHITARSVSSLQSLRHDIRFSQELE